MPHMAARKLGLAIAAHTPGISDVRNPSQPASWSIASSTRTLPARRSHVKRRSISDGLSDTAAATRIATPTRASTPSWRPSHP